MKVLLTGAHFTTAVAVIEELKKQDLEVIYVGRKTTMEGDKTRSVESRVLPEMGIKFIPITAGRIQRNFTPLTLWSIAKIPVGFLQALYILLRERPSVILSFGGYVAVPVVIAGWLLSIPIIIHEQTLVSGLANKISGYFAQKIAISFKGENSFNKSQAFYKSKTVLTGNPLRHEIIEISRGSKLIHLGDGMRKLLGVAKREKLPVVFITGGNQGSHAINLAVEGCLDKLLRIACVVHQCGDSKYRDFEKLAEKQSYRYLVSKFFFEEMPYLLKNADLVVSRAGANTLSELAYLGTPALVIPVPYLFKDEQNKNANFFKDLGLVKILPQGKLSSRSLLENIKESLKDLPNLKSGAKKAREVIIPDAAKRLALETKLLVRV